MGYLLEDMEGNGHDLVWSVNAEFTWINVGGEMKKKKDSVSCVNSATWASLLGCIDSALSILITSLLRLQ
jgi:hypothetical protein